jgi:hypothetical protein
MRERSERCLKPQNIEYRILNVEVKILLRFDIPCSIFDIQSALSVVSHGVTRYLVEKKLPRPLNGLYDHRDEVIFDQGAA